MLDSKVDKQIKRYLKSISDKKMTQSKINDSCHYYLTTEQGIFEVRFGDHFSQSGDRANFDIVKIRDLYIIKFDEIQYSLYAEDVLAYIKALFLVGPELSNQLKQSREQTLTALNSLNYYKRKWNKHQEDIKFMDDIWAEKEKVEKENKKLISYGHTYETLQSKYDRSQAELKASIRKFKTLQGNFNTLKKQFNQLNNTLNSIKQFLIK